MVPTQDGTQQSAQCSSCISGLVPEDRKIGLERSMLLLSFMFSCVEGYLSLLRSKLDFLNDLQLTAMNYEFGWNHCAVATAATPKFASALDSLMTLFPASQCDAS